MGADHELLPPNALGAGGAGSLGPQLVAAAQVDERVASATATVTFNQMTRQLVATLSITPSSGPAFELVLGTDGATVEILNGDQLG